MTIFKLFRLAIVSALLALGAASFSPAAHAADPVIERAIASGVVGERADGFLGLVNGTANADVQRKVSEVNVKRRTLYERLSRETGTTVEQVGIITGEKQIAKAAAGTYYMNASGQWVKK